MSKLVIRREFYKKADEYGDGPSFEQQFGILANAVVVDKFPELDKSKLAFQLLDKKEDNSKAAGVLVYVLNKLPLFLPVMFANGKVKCLDVIYIAKHDLFVPCTNSWLRFLKSLELSSAGELVDKGETDEFKGAASGAQTVQSLSDPIVKSACLRISNALETAGGGFDKMASFSVFDRALAKGPESCARLMDSMINDRRVLNAALHFYDAGSIDGFAKHASMLEHKDSLTHVVEPFTAEAGELTADEHARMLKDGYIIKTARKSAASVLDKDKIKGCFKTLSSTGKFELLTLDGNLESQLVVNVADMHLRRTPPECSHNTHDDADDSSARYMHAVRPRFAVLDGDHLLPVSNDTIAVSDGSEGFTPSMLQGHGKLLSNSRHDLSYPKIACPDGTVYQVNAELVYNKGYWYSVYESDGDKVVVLGDSPTQKAPIVLTGSVVFPAGARVLTTQDMLRNRPKIDKAYVRWGDFDVYINKYLRKNYRQVKITSNGSEARITEGSKDAAGDMVSVKEASLSLVNDYGVSPSMASTMLGKTAPGEPGRFKSSVFLVKRASVDDPWQDSALPMSKIDNNPPDKRQIAMPTELEDDPAKFREAVISAAQNGVKEVFDVNVIKMLLKNPDTLGSFQEDLDFFVKALDKLCRKYVSLMWHVDDFISQYGATKTKEIESCIKMTMDSISEVVTFFKLKGGKSSQFRELPDATDDFQVDTNYQL